MRLVRRVSAVLSIAVALACAGCGASTKPSSSTGGAVAANAPLPDWAPEDPSPEFLRAAKVLKPKPETPRPDLSAAEVEKRRAMDDITYPALYEFFGTLSDKQLQEFLDSGETRVPVKQLTAPQRKALDVYFGKYKEAHRDHAILELRDQLIELYKYGAAQDLSNVDVGFSSKTSSSSGHVVSLNFWIKGPDGSGPGFAYAFAYR